jgi:hypothetical protein
VGRAEELGRLIAALKLAEQGNPAIVLLTGDAGIGKTRLLAEMADEARRRGARVLLGGCLEVGDVGLPYVPILAALWRFAARADDEELLVASAKGLPGLDRLPPELASETTDATASRAGLDNCNSLTRYGRYSCASRGRAPSCWYWRICIGPTAPPATCWPSWSEHFTAGLPPFNRGELAEHPAAVSGKELPSTAVERIFARSEGNPFHAEELLATSNKAFSEWGQVFGEDVLASAILDRLLHHCDVISINGPSYRLKGRLKPSDGGGALE